MHASNRSSVALTTVAVGALYAVIGVVFAKFAPELLWRRLAWVVSAVAFAAHITYEHWVRGSRPRILAGRVAAAAAIGAFGLAAAANLHGLSVSTANHCLLAISLVAWPIVVVVPAFAVAFISAAVVKRLWPRGRA